MLTRRSFLGGVVAGGIVGGVRGFSAPVGALSTGKANLRFGLLSDLHIKCLEGDRGYAGGGPEIFEKTLRWLRDRNVDAVVIAGDMSDLGLGDELLLVAKTWFKVFPNDRRPDGCKVERLFVTGNHESYVFSGNGNLNGIRRLCGGDDVLVRRQLLRSDFAGWWERAFNEKYERFYHRNVKGYDFLNAHWDDGSPLPDRPLDDFGWTKGKLNIGPETFGVELGKWLDAHAKSLDPRRPFFYQQHRALYDTNYGKWAWDHDIGLATRVLSGYPNAVAFAGDTHYSLTDERSIWQGAFTSVGTGSLRYTGMPSDSRAPQGYENSSGKQKFQAPYDARNTAQGQLVTVYDDYMVFERRDFVCDRPVGDDWVVPLDAKDLRPYSFVTRAKRMRPPEFPEGARLDVSFCTAANRENPPVEKPCLRLMIPATEQTSQSRCLEYEAIFVGKGGETRVFHVLAEGFNKPVGHVRTSGKTELCVSLDRLPAEVVRVEVRPLDCWWHKGRSLAVSVVS